jgi:hypothetical protein
MALIHAKDLVHEPYQPVNDQGVTFKFDRSNLTLQMLDNADHWFYEIDLERCTDSAHLLDAILQIADKNSSLFSAAVIGDLIRALEDVAGEVFGTNLQGLYCPFGQGRRVDWRAAVDPNAPGDYWRLTHEQRKLLQSWIKRTLVPAARADLLTSYTWKHRFEGSDEGFYLTNGAFKGAMRAAGYQPTKKTAREINWRFKVKLIRKLSEKERTRV